VLLVAVSAVPVGSGHVPVIDRRVRWWSVAHQDPRAFAVLDTFTRLAHWQWVCTYLIGVAGVTALARRTLRPLRQTLLALVLLVLVTAVLKAVFGRPGPTGVAPPAYDGAWPSGHALALVVATVVILRLFPAARSPHNLRVALAFLPAGVLSAALVYCEDHWFSDVAVAFPLGLLLGWAALSLEEWGGRRHPLNGITGSRWDNNG
jgi:membrane-associated phospholipid phosphatase